MSQTFWKAKIRGLLHNFNLVTLRQLAKNDANSLRFINALQASLGTSSQQELANYSEAIALANCLTDASDRAVFNAAELAIASEQLKVSHLLSGARLSLEVATAHYNELKQASRDYSMASELEQGEEFSAENTEAIDEKQLFWWLWRCLPQVACNAWGESSLLIPAAKVLPDASLWSHGSLCAAFAGALVGYEDADFSDSASKASLPYLATFSFSPVQELIKASRKCGIFGQVLGYCTISLPKFVGNSLVSMGQIASFILVYFNSL